MRERSGDSFSCDAACLKSGMKNNDMKAGRCGTFNIFLSLETENVLSRLIGRTAVNSCGRDFVESNVIKRNFMLRIKATESAVTGH